MSTVQDSVGDAVSASVSMSDAEAASWIVAAMMAGVRLGEVESGMDRPKVLCMRACSSTQVRSPLRRRSRRRAIG
jgi:hypothetical protein